MFKGFTPSMRLTAMLSAMVLVAVACTPTAAPGGSPAATAGTPAAPGGSVAATSSPAGGASAETPSQDPGSGGEEGEIVVGHLNYYTGPFADVGPFFECATNFTIDLINEDPPLGREMRAEHGDLGTVGEAQAARRLLENDGADVLLNAAHEYASYRDFMLQYLQENDAPLMPSVHGGAVERSIGGIPTEPFFRGQPMDSAQASAGVLQVAESGAQTVAIVATEIAGSQLMADASVLAAAELGLEVVLELDVQPELPSYRSEVSRIASANPDAVLLFSQAQDGGTMVRQLAEAGESMTIVGSSEWLQSAFPEAATMAALEQHENVWVAGFTYADTEAFETYQPLWEGSDCTEFAEAENSYILAYYDLLNVTALAIEAAGSTSASAWAEHVREVAMEPGTQCFSYGECVELVRNGEDIDYSGISGEMTYTDTGVVSALFGVFEWASESDLELVTALDGDRILELDSLHQ